MSSLEFKEITLKNYRQYGGEQSIDLASNGGRINVIEGQNGAGKSNLLNAITMCFYGEEAHQSDAEEDLESLPYVTRGLLEDIGEGDSVTGYVEIKLGTDKPRYIFRRNFKTIKTESGFSNSHGDLRLQRLVGTEWKEPDNPATHLNQILPSTVTDYFLFDGEDLDAFFEGGYTDRVQSAILDVSHIELLNRSIDHMEKVQSDIGGKATDLEGEAGEIRKELDELEEKIGDLEDQHERTETDIQETQREIKRIDRRLQDISDEHVRDLYEERENKKEKVEQQENKVDELHERAAEIMMQTGPVVYTSEALEYTLDLFDDLSEKGQIPPKIQGWFIDELLERGECICGTPLSDGGEHVEELRAIQNDVEEVMEENLEGKSVIPAMMKTAEGRVERLHELRVQIAEIEEEIEDNKRRIEEVTTQLKRYDIPDDEDIDIEHLESQREELEEQKGDLQTELGRIEKTIEAKKEEKDTLEKDLRREMQKEARYDDVIKKLEFAETATSRLQDIKQTILADIREDTESNLEDYFNELIWKDETYDIRLHDDYSVEVRDPHGDNKIGSLSAGEKQVLALSFMAALTQISGFSAPILIDTPLGRISSEPKRRIAKNLPRYVEETQITFLMTDEEYTDEVRAMMETSLSNEYRLEYDETVTRVVAR